AGAPASVERLLDHAEGAEVGAREAEFESRAIAHALVGLSDRELDPAHAPDRHGSIAVRSTVDGITRGVHGAGIVGSARSGPRTRTRLTPYSSRLAACASRSDFHGSRALTRVSRGA